MSIENKLKLSAKQKEIVKLMREGFPFMMGTSETTGRPYYMIASTHNNGCDNTYMRGDVFSRLLENGLIYFDNRENEYLLSILGKTIQL